MESNEKRQSDSPTTPPTPAAIQSAFDALKKQSIVQRCDTLADRRKRLNLLHQAVVQHEAQIIEAMKADFQKPETEVVLTELIPFYTEIKHHQRHPKKWMRP